MCSPSLLHQHSVLSRVPGWCPAEVSPTASCQDGAVCLSSRATEVITIISLSKRLHSSTFQPRKPLLEEGKTGWPEDLRASLDVSSRVVPADNTWERLCPLLGRVGLLPMALCCVLISSSSPAKPSPMPGRWIKLPRCWDPSSPAWHSTVRRSSGWTRSQALRQVGGVKCFKVCQEGGSGELLVCVLAAGERDRQGHHSQGVQGEPPMGAPFLSKPNSLQPPGFADLSTLFRKYLSLFKANLASWL